VLALLAVGCAKEYDDTGLRELISGLDARVSELEASISGIQSTLGDGKFVRKVEEYKDPDTGRTTGVTVTYTDGNIVHFNIVPTDPTAGPVFSVIRNGAGALVWAVDGKAIKIDGEDVPVYQTPSFSIDEEGNLWVEVDGKKTNLGPVKSEGATLQDGIFTNLAVTDSAVVLTLSDGTTVNIPFAEAFKLNIETAEFTFAEPAPIEIPYTVSAKTEATVVGVAGYSPKEFSVAVEADKIVVTPLTKDAAAVMMAYADSKVGLVSVVNLIVEAEGFAITDAPYSETVDYLAPGEDAVVVANAVSNIPFEVKPQVDWIQVAEVRSQAYAITLKLDDNLTGEIREGAVNIVKAGTEDVVQTIVISQLASEKEEGPKDLGKKETANTYVVTAAGEYKFKAVKGNSAESVGAVAKAEVLWETAGNDEEAPAVGGIIASVGLDGDYITFTTAPGLKPGGATIVAKDASDAVLWTWFIWIPKTRIGLINDAAFYGLPVMDRNLGALDKATTANAGRETYGMYYQWGRNNPLPGKAKATAEITKEDGPKSTAYAIANPTVFIKVSESDSAGNWNEEDLAYLWEDENHNKAIYDPCPPGYKVPTYNAETGMFVNGNDGWTYNFDANNYAFNDVVFPMAGWYSSSSSVGYEKERSIFLSATAHSAPRARLKIVRKDKDGYYYANYFKQEAASVRCVAVDPNVKPYPEPEFTDPTVDLGKDGTANSYIVTAAGDYKFKAVKGNSEEAVAAASAEIVWETCNTAEAVAENSVIASVSVADGYVKFSTPATLKPGNAVIAAKDADGAIVWSWHIWVPATAIVTASYGNALGADAMDRNLGALVAAAAGDTPVDITSLGLLYQWGRKDPFPGAASLESHPAAAAVSKNATTKAEGTITLAQAIANPTLMGFTSNGDWIDTSDDTLWQNAGKTIYDPCPPGYRVPVRDGSMPFWSSDLSAAAGWAENKDNAWFTLGEPAGVFPFAGYVDDDGLDYKYAGTRALYWTSHRSGSVTAYGTDVRAGDRHKLSSPARARAGSVRCVIEVTE
jgi:hypothetical protein